MPKRVLIACCVLFAGFTSPSPGEEAQTQAKTPATTRKPNIVFILADDLGYRELGCYGQEKIKTPRLDRLATEGMRLRQHYSGCAVCAPSRCVLMTGKHPGHAFIRDNKGFKPKTEPPQFAGQYPIPDDEVTLAELLHAQGYATGGFGKWGLGATGNSGDPRKQGFDRFFGYQCQSHAHSYYPAYLNDDDGRLQLNNRPPISGHAPMPKDADVRDPRTYDQFKGTDYAPDRINEQALAFIRANRDRPFFLYYPTVLPHVALHVPDEDLKPYTALGWHDPPFTKRGGSGYTPHFTPRAAYAAMITRMDKNVGRVLDLLDELGLADDTIVVFTSDNGTTHLEKEVDYTFFQSVGKLRGLKGRLYEGGVRVPAIVRWPGHVPSGATSDRVTGFEDWLPTLLALIGEANAAPPGTDGLDFAPTLLGEKQKPRPFLYREFAAYGGQQFVRVDDWKAIRVDLRKGNTKIALYDLSTDPGEKHDVAADHPDVVARLDAIMRREHVPSTVFPLPSIDARRDSKKMSTPAKASRTD